MWVQTKFSVGDTAYVLYDDGEAVHRLKIKAVVFTEDEQGKRLHYLDMYSNVYTEEVLHLNADSAFYAWDAGKRAMLPDQPEEAQIEIGGGAF